jgi:hypothetical protein
MFIKQLYFYEKLKIIFYEAEDFAQSANLFVTSEYSGKLVRTSRISKSFNEFLFSLVSDISGG